METTGQGMACADRAAASGGERAVKAWLRRAVVLPLLLSSAVAGPANARAAGRLYGSGGGLPSSTSDSELRLRSADIVLVAHEDHWEVEGQYAFVNMSSRTQAVTLGFPELQCPHEAQCSHEPWQHVEFQVAGHPTRARPGAAGALAGWPGYSGILWSLAAALEPASEIRIHQRYESAGGRSDVGPTTLFAFAGRGRRGAAADWVRVTVRMPSATHTVYAEAPAALKTSGPLRSASGVELVLLARDWKPEGKLTLQYDASAHWAPERRGVDPESPAAAGELPFSWGPCTDPGADRDALRFCIQMLYAGHGYPFRSERLRRFFYSGASGFRRELDVEERERWVRDLAPLEDFSASRFEAHERQQLGRLTQALALASERVASSEGRPFPVVDEPLVSVGDDHAAAGAAGDPSPIAPPSTTSSAPAELSQGGSGQSSGRAAPETFLGCQASAGGSTTAAGGWLALLLLARRRRRRVSSGS